MISAPKARKKVARRLIPSGFAAPEAARAWVPVMVSDRSKADIVFMMISFLSAVFQPSVAANR